MGEDRAADNDTWFGQPGNSDILGDTEVSRVVNRRGRQGEADSSQRFEGSGFLEPCEPGKFGVPWSDGRVRRNDPQNFCEMGFRRKTSGSTTVACPTVSWFEKSDAGRIYSCTAWTSLAPTMVFSPSSKDGHVF